MAVFYLGGLVVGCQYIREQLKDDKGISPTIMLLHHYNKQGGVRGSTVLTAAADQILVGVPVGELKDQPMLWTTKGRNGKRKDRGPIEQWFEYKLVNMSMGEGCDPSDDEDPDDERYVPKWITVERYEPEMLEYCDPEDCYVDDDVRVGCESTLIVKPVKAPTPETRAATPKGEAMLAFIKEHGRCGVNTIMRGVKMTTKPAYKMLDILVEAGKIAL